MKSQIWRFLALAFTLTWAVWITAQFLGAGPDHGEYILAFGSAGPAIAAIFLSRRGNDLPGEPIAKRLVTFAPLWLFAWFVYLANDRLRGVRPTLSVTYALVGLLAIAPAWILSGAFTRDSGVRALLQSFVHPGNWRWQTISFLFFPALLLIPAAVARLAHLPLAMPQSREALWLSIAYAGIFFSSNFLFTAAFEEPGWRGFLLPKLQERFSPLLASIFVWLPWALWHAPLDLHRPFRFALSAYILRRVVFLIPISIILTWLYNRSGGNVLTAAIFHTSMNTFPFVLPYFPPALSLLIVFAIVVIFTDRMWRRRLSIVPETTTRAETRPVVVTT